MNFLWIIITVALSVLFLTLGIGANAAYKTNDKSSTLAIKFAFFMAVAYFCFYYIGTFIATKLLWDIMATEMKGLVAAILMLTMAVKTIWNVFSYKTDDNSYDLKKTPIQLFLSLAGGVNALLIGIALPLFSAHYYAGGIPILNSALMITLGAFAGTMSGAGLSPAVAKFVTKMRPALLAGIGFLIVAILFFINNG